MFLEGGAVLYVVGTSTRTSASILFGKHKATSGQSAKEKWPALVEFLDLVNLGYFYRQQTAQGSIFTYDW